MIWSSFCVSARIILTHDSHHDFMVRQSVPDAVRRYHQNFVILTQFSNARYFGTCRYTDTSRSHITNRSCHCQPWHLFIFQPNPFRPVKHASLALDARHNHPWLQSGLLNSPVSSPNSSSLVRLIRLVISWQLSHLPPAVDIWTQNGSRVSRIGTN